MRLFDKGRIVHDLARLKDMGVASVFVYDDEVVGHSLKQNQWLMELEPYVRPLGLVMKGQGRCSKRVINKEVMEAMYDMGFRAIMWGVESFSDKVLKLMKKGTTEEDIWHTLRVAKDAGIKNWLFLMVGNYGETEQDLQYTYNAVEKARDLFEWKQVTVCTPMPGTELWELAEKEGWATKPPEEGPQMHQVFAGTPWLSERQIEYWKMRLEAL